MVRPVTGHVRRRAPGGAAASDTGAYWFFTSNNIEVIVKVVDGRTFNGKYWVFVGALTDVQYTLTIRDVVTGAVKTYSHPAGTLESFADTSAF